MKQAWLDACLEFSETPGDFNASSRKIFRNVEMHFYDLENDLQARDVGYKNLKMSLLRKLYIHEESLEAAVKEWSDRSLKGKYGSTGFHFFNHITKPHSGETRNKRASKMGPCLQSMCLTIHPKGHAEVDVFYRTTEVYKKFPADLVLIRDDILSKFDFTHVPFHRMTCHFANMSVNPMFITVPLTLWPDLLEWFNAVKRGDPNYHIRCCRSLRTLLKDPEDISFKQVRNTAQALQSAVRPSDLTYLRKYINKELKNA